jgi:signal peptidase II
LQERSSVKPLPSRPLGQAAEKESAGRAPRGPFLLLISAITIPIIVLDQASKLFVKAHMALYESIALVPNYLDITYTLNPGAAFSILADAPPWARLAFLLSMSCTAVIVLLVLIARSERVSINSIAFALILAGAAGNLIDRATRGGLVIDFVRAHYYDLNYPVFNVADSAISIGIALIILASLFGGDAAPTANRSS